MAISLGSAALAFAGGAAKQFNKIADEERQAEAKRKERLQELVDQAMIKQEETKYSYEMSEYQKDLALSETLKSVRGGARSTQGQLAIAERRGLDKTTFLRSPDWGQLTWEGPGKAPIPYTERMMEYASGGYDPKKVKYAERYRQTNEGKTYTKDGAGILRGVVTDPTGRAAPMDIAKGLGLSENDPAYLALGVDESGFGEDYWELSRASLLPTDYDIKYDKDRGVTILTNKTTGESKAIKPKGMAEDLPSFEGASPEGKQIGDLIRLQNLVEQNGKYAPLLKRYEDLLAAGAEDLQIVHGTTVREDGSSYDAVKLIKKDPKKGMVEVGDPIIVGTGQDDPNSPDGRAMKDINAIVARTASAREMQDAIVFRMKSFTTGQAGAAAAITSTVDFFKNNVQGVMELAGVQRETMDAQLSRLRSEGDLDSVVDQMMQDNSYLTNFSKTNLEWLAYSMANVLKDVGDERAVTKYDIENGAKLVNRLFSTEGGLAAASELMYRLDVRTAQSHQMIYLDERATPTQKARSGKLLAKTVAPDMPDHWIIDSPQTGQVYVFSSEEHLNKFKSRVQEMGLLNKPVDKVLAAFPEELRPGTLESYIEDANGWLMPELDQARYLEKFSGQ